MDVRFTGIERLERYMAEVIYLDGDFAGGCDVSQHQKC